MKQATLPRPPALPPVVVGSPATAEAARPLGVPGAPDCTVLTDPVLVGRGALLAELVARARLGRHTLLVGDEGIGKTRLLVEVAAVAAGKRVLLDAEAQHAARTRTVTLPQAPREAFTMVYVPEAGPAGRLAEALTRALHALGLLALPDIPPEMRAGACREYDWKEVRKLLPTIEERERAVLVSLHDLAGGGRAPRLVILLDALDRASATQGRFLCELQKRCTVLGACRQVPHGRSLRTFFATFAHLPIAPLPERHMAALFDYFVERYAVACADPRHYAREALRRAEGNPAILRAMLHDGAQARLVSRQDVRDLQARDDAPFFNMGLIYVFGLIGFGAARVVTAGLSNTDLTIVLSVITVLGYLVFRVFRGLFMWQPRPDAK
jgi:hypothetical protein